jgi:demethylspheroidene O-methyltransferase
MNPVLVEDAAAALAEEAPAVSGPSGWGERWRTWRDRLLASQNFRRRAAGLWLTRPLARRRARELFDVMAGFVYSQVLLACVRLKLFDLLAHGPQTAEALAPQLGLSVDAAQRLLAAAASLRLAERRGPRHFGLGPLGATMVGNTAIEAMVEHHATLYTDLADPVALLRTPNVSGALAQCFAYATADAPGELSAQTVRDYSAVMAASQPLVADEVLDAYPVQRHRRLLDVGGGEGVFLAAVAHRAPQLELMLFDLPAVAAAARHRLAQLGLSARVAAHGGDFFRDALPQGADLVTLVRVIHDHTDEGAAAILRAVRAALPAGGTLLLAEQMADTPGAQPMGDAYFGFYLLAMGRGRPRSAARLTAMLLAAGFQSVRPVRTRMPLQVQVLVATA